MISAIVLIMLGLFITDKNLSLSLLSLGFNLAGASIVETILYFINPKLFKNKPTKFNA